MVFGMLLSFVGVVFLIVQFSGLNTQENKTLTRILLQTMFIVTKDESLIKAQSKA